METNGGASETAEKLRKVVEEIERIEAQIAHLNRAKRDSYALARKSDIHVPALKRVVRYRAKDPKRRADEEDAYWSYLSLLDETHSTHRALARTRVHAREENASPARPQTVDGLSPAHQPPDPRCRKPGLCGGYSKVALCEDCKGAEQRTAAVQGQAMREP